MEELTSRGWAVQSAVPWADESERQLWSEWLAQAQATRRSHEAISGRRVLTTNAAAMPKVITASPIIARFRAVSAAYFGCDAVLLGCQFVWAQAFAPEQSVHRDHASGPRCALTFVFSTQPHETVTTRLDDAVRAHERSPPLADMRARMTSPNAALVCFDAYIRHAGAENTASVPVGKNRVFLTFFAPGRARSDDALATALGFSL